MPSPYGFKRLPVRVLDRKLYGRVTRGYQHPTGLRLVHHKPRCHTSTRYHQIGMWVLCDGDHLVARKAYYGRRQKVGPLQWADKVAREHLRRGRPCPAKPIPDADYFDRQNAHHGLGFGGE